jgi:hypothetical protein
LDLLPWPQFEAAADPRSRLPHPKKTIMNMPNRIALVPALSLLILICASARAASYGSADGKDIGSFMERLHKGKDSYADKAKKGQLTSTQLQSLAKNYRLMMTMNPPKNKAAWRKSVGDLVNATARLARSPSDKGLVAAYAKAADCNACHQRHR